jgi:glucose/arabinose dehydrogenase
LGRSARGIDRAVALAAFAAVLIAPWSTSFAQIPPRVTVGRMRVELERLNTTGQLTTPIYMDNANDGSGRLFFAEKGGATRPAGIRVRQPNGSFSTFLELCEALYTSERGLLGFAFHPGYSDPESLGYRKLYTYHSVPVDEGATVDFTYDMPGVSPTHHNVVTEWQVSESNPNLVDVTTRREIFREAHPIDIHNAGTITFGPDGYLYGSNGTATQGALGQLTSQVNTDLLGVIYRIDPLDPTLTDGSPDSISANGKYRIPADNPFVSDPNALDEIFAYGLRNRYRFSIDPVSGHLFAGDVGEGAVEEVSVVTSGGNMGWPYREGTIAGPVATPMPAPTFVPPIMAYSEDDGQAVVGGHIYHGSIPALQGKYIFGDFSYNFFAGKGRLFIADPLDAEGNVKDPADVKIEEMFLEPATCTAVNSATCGYAGIIFSFGLDEDGEIYVVGLAGSAAIYKVTDANLLPEGDYNEDGTVDAADYTLWRNTLGQSVLTPTISMNFIGHGREANGNRNGVIDEADYEVWKEHFGETV